MNRFFTLAIAGCLLCVSPAPGYAQLKRAIFIQGLNAPVEMVPHPTDSTYMFVVQQGGLIRTVHNGQMMASPFLDLTQHVSTGGERGLLGMAFAPDFATSRRFYVNFTNLAGHTVVARFNMNTPPPVTLVPSAIVSSRFDLRWGGPSGTRWIAQPYSNHNGGHIAFGADGYLYVGMGDGGSGGDPENRAQDPNTLLGKMLRIDVSVPDAHTEGYVVPTGNPFVGGGALPEIWSFGLRNPWKFNFDTTGPGGAGTQAMIIGDVGQGAREEVNYEPAGRGGRNYGWRLREGTLPYLPNTTPAYLPLTDPIHDYPRSDGQSITGGYVYRGTSLRSGFRGRYFYADFVSGRVWSLGLSIATSGEATVTDRVEHTTELGGSALGNIASFARDSAGELYVLSFNGTIFKLMHDPASTGPIGGTPGPVSTNPPLGQVDTPTQNASGVVGAIGMTGWAVDDAGIAHVRIYRNCLAGVDNPASCQTVLGTNVVFVGQAAFLPGARPDVESAFSNYPNANQAGWGMLILSPMLPHVPLGQVYGGQGPITLYAVATDNDGLVTLLGRSWGQGTSGYEVPTSVTLANDTIAKPFGTIDTPAEAATVSGSLANFGWALTPDANNSVDGPSDILMPINGATMLVYVDGVSRGAVAYNQCRGSVGNPVPAGAYCNDDVASAFGHPSPQTLLTPRTSNPTRFRNLDAGRGAIGAFVIDTTTFSNGRHTIAWGVEDSSGRSEGLGSRFFTVQNGGADAPVAAPRIALASVTDAPSSSRAVWGATGFQQTSAWYALRPDINQQRYVRVPEMGRVQLQFDGPVDAGFVAANGTLRELPVGSLLSGHRFTWVPAPGHLGTYDLVFLRSGERIDVQVTVAPLRFFGETESQVQMTLDRVEAIGDGRTTRVDGWAFDPEGAIGSGVGTVHVWAESAAGPVFLGVADLGAARPDVATVHGQRFGHAGFTLTSAVALPPGTYTVTAYVWLERTQRWEDARSKTVVVR